MTILAGDIKLVASQVMADTANGGGAPTTTVIADAVSNALFPDISELDRAAGRVNLRKVFVHVQTPNVDSYFGANVIVAEPPEDPNVAVTIFSNREVFDRRSGAQSRVEAYLNSGPRWPGMLYENHLTGQRVIQICQRTTEAAPAVGRTLVLTWHQGLSDEKTQYVRVTRVDSVVRTFTDDQGDYTALIVTCDLSDALRYDFVGTAANRRFIVDSAAALIRDTVVADAGNYFGVVPLTNAAVVGDAQVVADSIYTQLVPSARTEMSIIDALPANNVEVVLADTPRRVAVNSSPNSQRIKVGQENRGFNFVSILTPKPAPGTVRAQYRVGGNTYSLSDDGLGALSGSGTGTVNYITGSISITLQALPDDRSSILIFWGQKITYTNRSSELNFRPPEWSFALANTHIVPGTVSVSWTSGGLTKTATANAVGTFSGDATGNVNHASGMVFLKPSAMIDSGGDLSIDYQWAEVIEETLTGLSPDAGGLVALTFSQTPVAGSVSAEWVTVRESSTSTGVTSNSGSTAKLPTGDTNGSMAALSSSPRVWNPAPQATQVGGYDLPPGITPVTWANGVNGPVITLSDGTIWNGGPKYRILYDKTPPTAIVTQHDETTGASHITGSSQTARNAVTVGHVITEDGVGHWYGTFGTINYAGKAGTLKVVGDYSETSYQSEHEESTTWESLNSTSDAGIGSTAVPTPPSAANGGGGSSSAKGGSTSSSTLKETYASAGLTLKYRIGAGATHTVSGETFQPLGITIDFVPRTHDQIVPGSIQFTWMGHTFRDFDGTLYFDGTSTVPGTFAGIVDYLAGTAQILDYVVGSSPGTISVQSLWTTAARGHHAEVLLATQVSPLKPTGLVISATGIDGTQVTGTSGLDGMITGTHLRGKVEYESGAAEIQFGDYVLDTSLTAAQKLEWWYNAADVRTDGKIWKPWPIDPSTVRYNAAAFKYLPLDASILGLDPVRLPSDGRVPIFRAGSFAVVGHTGTVGPATVTGTVGSPQVINCGRVRLSRVRVIGGDGLVINTGYSADLETGLVTFTNTSGYVQPITVEHRIEDMALVSDAQISGRLSFTRQLTHNYPVPGSYVSSALVAGDMQTYVSVLFDQVSWTNVWSDSMIGSAATGTFNDALAPIGVTNEGTVTERWMVQFTNTTSFNVIGEHVGLIAVGSTAADCAPINPATGHPYFTLVATGWGGGWSNGNVLRFNTVGTIFPVWVVRTIQQGPETVATDKFTLLVRGDVDRP